MKCIQCGKGRNLIYHGMHQGLCASKWDAQHIPKSQKREKSQCPKCKVIFYYWQNAHLHAIENNHYGFYGSHRVV